MGSLSLQEFVSRTGAKSRITFGDVRRLQRDVLPEGISSREEAELLLRLDGQVARADAAWTDWLVGAITDFVVWGERPTGAVESEAALWLKNLLNATGAPTKAARRIAREIRHEAEQVAEPLRSYIPDTDMSESELVTVPARSEANALSLTA